MTQENDDNNNNNKDNEKAPTPKKTVQINVTGEAALTEDISSEDSTSNNMRRRPVSVHRKTLDRILQDSSENQRHYVPDPLKNDDGHSSVGGNDSTAATYWNEKTVEFTTSLRNKSCREWCHVFLPMTKWLETYQWKSTLLQDVIAGLTVGVMIVPQSMSYAKLAGLPVEYGLYSALTPVILYSVFGSSRQLAVGPVALISLLLSTGVSLILTNNGITPETTPNYDKIYATLAVQTSFMVGVVYIIMGILRLGFVTIFLSHAVISGFTTGAAVIIGMSQLKHILGYDVQRSDVLHELIHYIIQDIDKFNYKTFLVGTLSVFTLVGLKHVGKTYPKLKWVRALGPLTVTVVTIVIQVLFDLESQGIPIVGTIPRGLPSLTFNLLTPIAGGLAWTQLLLVVISIVIVGFMESIAIAKQLASKHKYEVDSSMELIGLGMANLGAGFFHGYPVTGSFSRSAVNNESGAQSGISGLVTALLVGFVLLFLTPVFEQLPLAVLAAIVVSGVLGLLDYEEAIYLYRVHKFDFCVWVVACVGTLFLGVEIGLGIAVAVSLLIVTYESAYPHTAVLGRLPGTTVYRNVKQYPRAELYRGIVMVRIDAPIYFANTQNVREKIRKYEERAEEQYQQQQAQNKNNNIRYKNKKTDHNEEDEVEDDVNECAVRFIILELSPVSHIDTSALHILHDMNKTYRDRGIQICFSNPSVLVMKRLVSSGLADEVGRDHIFVTLHDAVNWCLGEMDIEALSTTKEDPPRPEDVIDVLEITNSDGNVDVELGTDDAQDNRQETIVHA